MSSVQLHQYKRRGVQSECQQHTPKQSHLFIGMPESMLLHDFLGASLDLRQLAFC